MGYGVIINTDDIVGIYEIAEYAGVRTTAVINWKNRYSDFPKPVGVLKATPIYNMKEVKLWLEKRADGRNEGIDRIDVQIQRIIRNAERNGDKRPTLREIGAATGVSAQTVSNRLRKMNGLYKSKSKEKAEYNRQLEKELVEYVESFKSINGTIPTRRQMMEDINIKSVAKLYQILESIGYIDGDKPKQVYRYIKEYKCIYDNVT